MTISAIGKKLVREVGSPEDIYQSLRIFRRDVNLLANQRRELTKKYPNKWIAFHDREVVFVSDTLNSLLHAVDKGGLPRDKVVTQFLGTQKITMVL